jgi:predicted secreted protein
MGLVTQISGEPVHTPVDVTALDSNGVKQYVAGARDATLSLEVELDSENDHHNDLIAGCLAGTRKNFAIIPNNDGTNAAGVTYSGAAFVTATPLTLPTDEKQTMSVTLQVSGGMTTNSV